MTTRSLFADYWSAYASRSIEEKRRYYYGLSKTDRHKLLNSFYNEGWPELFYRNMLDETLTEIRDKYNIDLLDLRIQAVKFGRVFLIDQETWDRIERLVWSYADYLDLTFLFGGLMIISWGKNNQCYRIRAKKDKWR
jgi:hypothetical protein